VRDVTGGRKSHESQVAAYTAERHIVTFEGFDLHVSVGSEGNVEVSFHAQGKCVLSMDFDTFRDVIDCVGRFGLAMKSPMLVEEEVVKDGE